MNDIDTATRVFYVLDHLLDEWMEQEEDFTAHWNALNTLKCVLNGWKDIEDDS